MRPVQVRAVLLAVSTAVLAPLAAVAVAGTGDPTSYSHPQAAQAAAVAIATPLSVASWFYDDPAGATGGVTSTAGQPPIASPTPVPAGSLGTGYKSVPAGAPAQAGVSENDKEAFVSFNLKTAPKGTKITSFVVTVPVDTSDATSLAEVTAPNTPPAIVACRAAGQFAAADSNPQVISKAPGLNCGSEQVTGVFDPMTNSYTFALQAMAQKWVDGTNTGVGFIQDQTAPPAASYTLSLGPATSITAVTMATPAPAVTASPTPTTAKTSAAPTPTPAAETTAVTASPTPSATPKSTSKASPKPAAKTTTAVPTSTAVRTTAAPPPTTSAPVVVQQPPAVLPAVVPSAPAPAVDAPSVAPAAPTDAPASTDAPSSEPAPETSSVAAIAPVTAPSLTPAAAKTPVDVHGLGAGTWIVLVLVLLGIVAAVSLSLSAAPTAEAGSTGTSRLTRLLNGGSSA